MTPVSPQAVSQLLSRNGADTVLWSDRFKKPGVSAQQAANGEVQVNVDYASRGRRDGMELFVIAVLVEAGYRVKGGAGVLFVSRGGS